MGFSTKSKWWKIYDCDNNKCHVHQGVDVMSKPGNQEEKPVQESNQKTGELQRKDDDDVEENGTLDSIVKDTLDNYSDNGCKERTNSNSHGEIKEYTSGFDEALYPKEVVEIAVREETTSKHVNQKAKTLKHVNQKDTSDDTIQPWTEEPDTLKDKVCEGQHVDGPDQTNPLQPGHYEESTTVEHETQYTPNGINLVVELTASI